MADQPTLTESPAQVLRSKTLLLLRALLTSKAKVGVPVHNLPFEYEETCMEKLKIREMGYGSLEQFLRDIPEICTVCKAPEGYLVAKGKASVDDAHIFRLVSGQKKEKQKKRSSFAKKFNINQVRRRASHFTAGHRPNPSSRNSFINSSRGTSTVNFFGSTSGHRKPYVGQSPIFRQAPSNQQRQVSSLMPNPYIPPRFQRLQQPNRNMQNRKSNEVIVISDDEKPAMQSGFFGHARLPGGERILVGPSTSTPSPIASTLSPSELSAIETKFRNMMLQRTCGVWYARMKEEYKAINKVDAPPQLEAIVQKHFLHFLDIQSLDGSPDRKIMYLKKGPTPSHQTASPANQIKTPNSSTSQLQQETMQTNNLEKRYSDLQVTASFSQNQDVSQRTVEQLASPVTNDIKRKSLSPLRSEQFKIDNMDIPGPGDTVEVYVCHVESLDRFFVQLSNSPIDDLVEKMQSYYSGLADGGIMKPRHGEFCCARYSKDRLWFRAKILSVKEQKNLVNESYRCHVMYVDYGNDEFIVSNELKSLTKEFSELPTQAIQCSLYDIFPLVENTCWTEKDNDYFKKITDGILLTLSVQQRNGLVLSVDLLDEKKQSICHHLHVNGLARRAINNSSSSTSLSRSSSSSDLSDSRRPQLTSSLSVDTGELSISWVEIPGDEDYIDALVSNINSTNDLSIVIIGPHNLERLEKLESELKKHFDSESVLPSTEFEIGKFYVAFVDDIWHRVKLLSTSDNECEVLLLDRGKRTVVSTDEMKDLPMKYCKLPFQAIHCSLAKVPLSFDPEILQYLSEATLGEARIAYILERPGDTNEKYNIELYDTSSDLDVNINCEIIAKIEAEKDLRPKLPEIGSGSCQAYIAHIAITGEFFIQVLGPGLERLEILMEDMTSHFSQTRASEIVSRPEVGTICCAKFRDDGSWYRAKVTRVMQKERKVEVEFIDYGNREVIINMLIRKPNAVNEKVLNLPFQAVKCKLEGLAELDDERHKRISDFVTNYVELVSIEVIRNEHNIPVINITIPSQNESETPVNFLEKYKQYEAAENEHVANVNYNTATSSFYEQSTMSPMFDTVNSTFENISMAGTSNTTRLNSHNMTLSEWEVIDNLPEKSSKSSIGTTYLSSETGSNCTLVHGNSRSDSPATTYCASWGIPHMKIEKKYLAGVVQDATDPYKFSLVPHALWNKLEKLHIDMRNFYNTYNAPDNVTYQVGDVCAVYHIEHDVWYRAVIQAQVEEQMLVKFPDFSGTCELVNMETARPLQKEFKVLPFLAIRCRLSGIEPVRGEKVWSNEAAMKFYDLVMNETFQVEITSSLKNTDKPLEVRLHGVYAGKRIVVNDHLVNMGVARRKLSS